MAKPCCPHHCEAPATSVMDDLGLHDELAAIVIIGGGPHALACLAALHQDDDLLQKIGTVCVISPGSQFMQSWNIRFGALEINHLRSPAFAHPAAFEPTALLDFATLEGRTSELIDAPVNNWLPTTDLSSQGLLLKALPSSALFRDFCSSLETRLPHRWLSGTATSVCKDSSTGKFRVHYAATAGQRERKVMASAVILATGPIGEWNVPTPFKPHLASEQILHTEALLAESKGTLSEEITRRCPGGPTRVLIIGGGISAAQAALAALRAGHQVVLRSRRPLQTRPFDVGPEWIDVRTADRLRFEFLCLPMKKRREAVREATSGGSVPAQYMEELSRLAKSSTDLRLEVDEEIDRSHVCLDPDGDHVVVNGETFAMVILATGVVTTPSCSSLYQSVEELFGATTVDGLPCVDSNLRWAPKENIFVLGANAVLELGPGGGNLMGAMRGARVVANELHGLMWRQSEDGRRARPTRPVFSNMYASLGDRGRFGDGSESELEALALKLNLSPQAVVALRKGRKGRQATKGLKGERAPLARINARERRVAYS